MKSRDQHIICTKLINQGTFQKDDQAAHRRVRLSKTYRCLARISSDQGPFLSAIKQSGQISYIKNRDPSHKWLYRPH